MADDRLIGAAAVEAALTRKRVVTTTHTSVLDPVLAEQYREAIEHRDRRQALVDALLRRFRDEQNDERLVTLQASLDQATAERDEAEAEVQRLAARVGQTGAIRWYFRAIGRHNYDALAASVPASKAQIELHAKLGEKITWDTDRFPPLLIAASAYVPVNRACACGVGERDHPWSDCDQYDGGTGDLLNDGEGDPMITREQAQELWKRPEWNGTELTMIYLAAQAANVNVPDLGDLGKAFGSTRSGAA